VFAARIATDIASVIPETRGLPKNPAPSIVPASGVEMNAGEKRLRELMSSNVGVIRSGSGLANALAEISEIEAAARSNDLRDMAISALMIAAAAYVRTESRGAHFRSDFPQADPAQARRSYLTLSDARAIAKRAAAKAA
jgi:L-aspartate oxidase